MNAFFSLTVVLLAMIEKIPLTSGIPLAHAVICPSSWAFARLRQVTGVSYLNNFFARMQSQRFAVLELSNTVIDVILATTRTD